MGVVCCSIAVDAGRQDEGEINERLALLTVCTIVLARVLFYCLVRLFGTWCSVSGSTWLFLALTAFALLTALDDVCVALSWNWKL